MGKERERERCRERGREEGCQKQYTISKWPVHSPHSFDSRWGGCRSEKYKEKGLGKEGVIYRDPHMEDKEGR